jgi:hypothetical protein
MSYGMLLAPSLISGSTPSFFITDAKGESATMKD